MSCAAYRAALAAGVVMLCLVSACDPPGPTGSAIDVSEALGGAAATGFARAVAPRTFVFPEDHGPHPDFRNEWWYLTGNLEDGRGRRYGYQLTFFRIGLAPDRPDLESAWATSTLWMAHAAVTDVAAGTHRHDQRLARGALGLAGAEASPLRVWLGGWSLEGSGDSGFPWAVSLSADGFALELSLQPQRAPVLQGDSGLSQKSGEPGNASYYYSVPRLATAGVLSVGGAAVQVSGQSWLDREWSTSALGTEQEGWDWFSLQLGDGSDLMLYRLRRRDGATDRYSAGTLSRPGSAPLRLGATDFTLTPRRFWRDDSGARYPVSWLLEVPRARLALEVEALLDDQLMDTVVRYWEGAVSARDARTGAAMGRGYLEMTGY